MIVEMGDPKIFFDHRGLPDAVPSPLNEPAVGPSRRRGSKGGRDGGGGGLSDDEAVVDEEDGDWIF